LENVIVHNDVKQAKAIEEAPDDKCNDRTNKEEQMKNGRYSKNVETQVCSVVFRKIIKPCKKEKW